jgi:hypothetical protein
MSKLQNDFTTPEQSKRLLELGVPKNSANLYYNKFGALEAIPEYRNFNEFCDASDTPCWSVGRLMKIFAICFDPDFIEFDIFADGTTFLQQMIDKFETCIDAMDFSKLEE